MCLTCCRLDLSDGRIGPAIGDVVAHRAFEEPRILKDHAEGRAKRGACERLCVMAVDLDRARIHVVEAQKQVDQSRLAAACRADKRKACARLGRERYVLEKLCILPVGEAHILEGKLPLRILEDNRIVCIGLLFLGIKQCEHAPGRGEGCLDLRHDGRDLVEGLHVLVRIREEALHLADGQRRWPACHDRRDADSGNRGVDDVVDQTGRRVREGAYELSLAAGRIELPVDSLECSNASLLVGKGAHKLLVRDHLFCIAGKRALERLLRSEALRRAAGNEPCDEDGERRQHDDDHSNRHREREHEDERARNHHDAIEELREALHKAVSHGVDIVDDTGEQVAMSMGIEEGERHAVELVIGIDAQVSDRLVGKPIRAIAARPVCSCRDSDCAGQADEDRLKRRKIDRPSRYHRIDGVADQDGDDKLCHDRDDRARKRAKRQRCIGLHIM